MKAETEFESRSLKRTIFMLGSLITIFLSVPSIASAYSASLIAPPPTPVTNPFTAFNAIKPVSNRISKNFLPQPPTVAAPVTTPHSEVFIGRLLKQAASDRSRTLWSMYPASVRGRVFGAEGGDPMTSASGW